jgi:hypothetical protein
MLLASVIATSATHIPRLLPAIRRCAGYPAAMPPAGVEPCDARIKSPAL